MLAFSKHPTCLPEASSCAQPSARSLAPGDKRAERDEEQQVLGVVEGRPVDELFPGMFNSNSFLGCLLRLEGKVVGCFFKQPT